VRYSPIFDEIIEFDVELSEIPMLDERGKDIVVNWKMFDDFEANNTFWTDSNGLEMQKRVLNYNAKYRWKQDFDKLDGKIIPP